MPSPRIHQGRPQEFDGPRQANQAQQTNVRRAHPHLPQVHGKEVVKDAERQALGEIQQGHPGHEALQAPAGWGGRRLWGGVGMAILHPPILGTPEALARKRPE